MNEGTVITGWVLFGVFVLYSFFIFIVGYTVGHHYGKHESEARIEELESVIEKTITYCTGKCADCHERLFKTLKAPAASERR